MPAQQRALKEIFLDALAIPSSDRSAWLDTACGADPDLRRRVEVMLAAHDQPQSLIDQLAPADAPPNAATGAFAPRDDDHTRIGPYKLLQKLGEGGMGTVYMAEQEEPVKRRVALKIIKAGMDSRHVLARFEAERQALAMMDHPHIAKVLDAGATDAGRPYFVMELVKGIPITKFCDQQHLTPRERLELFVPVCQAIQHAHQKGIIHRDIKPSNVLIALYDGKPVVKVIDFGVAKATAQKLTERTMFTEVGQIVGTLEYMAPEQAELNNLDIDTRADIYSLGVLLYELLTGSPPFTAKELRSVAFTEMLRMIRESEPPKPSTKLSSSDELPSIAANRKLEPAKLTRLVRGELDWIVMKALEKDRSRRYETANGFARDIERYLADEPVQACPPSARYRLGKFVRRHKAGLAVAVLILFLLVLVGGGVGWLVADRAARHREAEAKVLEALEAAGPRLKDGNPADLALLSAAQRVEAQLGSGAIGPEVRRRAEQFLRDVRMLKELDEARLCRAESKEGKMFNVAGSDAQYAAAFSRYGIDVLALDPAEAATRVRASAIHEALLAGLDDWLQIQGANSYMKVKPGHDPGRERLRRVADMTDDSTWRRAFREAALAQDKEKLKALATQPEALAQPPAVLAWLGSMLGGLGLSDQSEAVLRQAQQRHPLDFWINYHLGFTLIWRHPAETVGYCQVAVAIRPRSAEATSLLGLALKNDGETDAAIAALQQAIALDPKFGTAYDNLGWALRDKGDFDGAFACFKKALECMPEWRGSHEGLGVMLRHQGKLDEAIAALQQAIKLDPKYAWAHCQLGRALLGKGDFDGAVACFKKAIEDDPNNAGFQESLGEALCKQGKLDEAIASHKKAIRVYQAAIQRNYPDYAEAYWHLGLALLKQGRFSEALADFKCYHELGSTTPDPQSDRWVRDAEQLVALEGKLPKLLKGEAQPAGNAERLALATCAYCKKLYAAASRFYAQAFAAEPELADNLHTEDRYAAACAAAMAGCGQGEDAAKLDEQERARLRRQALDWLRADLALRAKQATGSRPEDRAAAQKALEHWLEDPDFAGVRGEALAKLPEADRHAWRTLWADVAENLARARAAAENKSDKK